MTIKTSLSYITTLLIGLLFTSYLFAQSENSQNEIGKSQSYVKFKYSKNYNQPKVLLVKNKFTNQYSDTMLLFRSREIENHTVACLFHNGKCFKTLITYPYGESLKKIIEIYNEIFVTDGYLKWIEYTKEMDYTYWIEKLDKWFCVHIELKS